MNGKDLAASNSSVVFSNLFTAAADKLNSIEVKYLMAKIREHSLRFGEERFRAEFSESVEKNFLIQSLTFRRNHS